MRPRFLAAVSSTFACVVLLAGCGQGGAPEPSVQTGMPTPSVSVESEARQVFEALSAEETRLAADGRASTSPRLAELAAGEYLKDAQSSLANQVAQGFRLSGSARLVVMRPVMMDRDSGTFKICMDGRDIKLLGPDGKQVGAGDLAEGDYRFERMNGRLVVVQGKPKAVASCAS